MIEMVGVCAACVQEVVESAERARRYVSLYTYTRGQVNALSPPAEAAEEILISRFFVELFLALHSGSSLLSPSLGEPSPPTAPPPPHIPIPTKAEARKSSSRPAGRPVGRPGH